MKKSFYLLAILFATSSLPAAWSNQANEDGIKAYRQGDYSKAEQLYRQALTQETDGELQAAIYRNLNVLYSAQGKDGTEFAKKADELDPPNKPISRGAGQASASSLVDAQGQVQTEQQFSQNRGLQYSPQGGTMSGGFGFAGGAGGYNSSAAGPGFSSASSSRGYSLGGTFGSGSRGGILNGLGGSFNSYRGAAYGAPGAPGGFSGNGATVYGTQIGNNANEFSTSTPVVVPGPNGGAYVINAGGPNVYSSQQAPDGSTTTIIKQTY